jgi:O-antigen/teichoic acid export membrane protein
VSTPADPAQGAPADILDTGAAGGRAIRGGALRTSGYFATSLMGLVAVPFMTRHLGPVDLGYYTAVASIVFILGGITEAGLTNLAVREYTVLHGAAREAYMRNIVGLRFALTSVGILLAIAVTAITGAPGVVVTGTAISGLALLITLSQQTYMVPLTAQLRLGWVTALDLIRQTTLSSLMIGLVIVGAGLVPFFWAGVAAALATIAATVVLVRGEAELRPSFDLPTWRQVLRETLPYAVAVGVGLIYFRIAVVLMSYASTETQTGYFSAAFRIVEAIAVVPWIVVSSGFPILARAARDDEGRLAYALQRLFEVSAALGAWIALCIGVGAPFAIELIAGPKFEESVDILRIQGLGLVTAFLVATWLFALLSLKLFRQLLAANAVAAVVSIAGTLALSPSLGGEGAAIATVAAEASLAIGCLVALRRARRALSPRVLVVPKVLAAAAAGLAPALVLDLHPVIEVVLSTFAYFAVLLALRGLPYELFNALRGRDPEPTS